MISFNNSIIDVVSLPFRGNYVTQDTDGHVARVHRGIDAQASIPTGKAKPALASQEPALNSRNGFPGGGGTNKPNTAFRPYRIYVLYISLMRSYLEFEHSSKF